MKWESKWTTEEDPILGVEEKYGDLPTANIIVAGITGTGKSTLINAVFGKELAATGSGIPVTDHISEYEAGDIPIRIWDTVGLELDSNKTKESIQSIKKTIIEQSHLKNRYDCIHAIWYCINSGSNRYQGAELGFIKELYQIGVPFIIVLTQCTGAEEQVNAFENKIREINKSEGLKNIEIVQVLAQEVKYRGMPMPIPAFGLDTLVEVTLKKMPEFIKIGFIAAQRVNQAEKRKASEDIIWTYVDAALRGFWDKVLFVNVFKTDNNIKRMFSSILKLYNMYIPEEALNDILESQGSLDIPNGFYGLISPIRKKYNMKLDEFFRQRENSNYNMQKDKLPHSERAARMIAYYGYTFIDTLEQTWEDLTEEQLEQVDVVVAQLQGRLKGKWKQNRSF